MIYFDHAATGLPRCSKAVERGLEAAGWATPGRGLHSAQSQSEAAVQWARTRVADLVGGGVVVFCAGTTAALNMALSGWEPAPARVALGPLVHNAVRRPVAALGVPSWTLPHDRHGAIDLAELARAWQPGTDLVALGHGSNVTGALQPVAEIVEFAHRHGARVLVDAAQTAGLQVPLELGEVDAVAFSAHKGLRALPGCGALVLRNGTCPRPTSFGGTGFDARTATMPADLPARLEPGTPNLPGIVAMGCGADACLSEPWDYGATATQLREVVRSAGLDPLAEGVLPLASFNIPGWAPQLVEEALDRSFDIVVRAGLHCSPSAHGVLGTEECGTVRVSAGVLSSEEDFQALGRALRELRKSGS